jgi:N-acetylglucosamine kinase-like BadF-type ATPase
VKRPAVLAVDSGGSKTDVALLRKDGTVLGAARVAGAHVDGHPWLPNESSDLVAISTAIEEAATRAGYDAGRRPLADVGSFCLAGADLPSDDRRLLRWIRRNGWVDEPILRNDTFAVLRAGTERAWGVAVVCGFGTNCSGVSPDGKVARFPAIGPISGDWGGGNELGSQAAWHAIRSQDGRGRKTSLQQAVPAHFGLRTPRQLMEAVYYDRIHEDRLAELAPVVFQEAGAGDGVARDIVDRQSDEIVVMATTVIRRLRLRELDVDVVLGGGIFRNRDRRFFDRIHDGLVAVAPRATIRRVTGPPIVGAALIGLDALGASASAQAAARDRLTHARLSGHTPGRKET